jgi:hypothetical protein
MLKYRVKLFPEEDSDAYRKQSIIHTNSRRDAEDWARAILLGRPECYVTISELTWKNIDTILPISSEEQLTKKLPSLEQ